MFYIKLSIKNLTKSILDYSIYFGTLVLLAAVIYAFRSLSTSRLVLDLSKNFSIFPKIIGALTGLVFLIGILIVRYSILFIFQQRKREFAIYTLLGIKKYHIMGMFCIENLFLGIAAFVIGILLGMFLNAPLSYLIMWLLKSSHEYHITLSGQNIIFTLISFGVFYLFGLIGALTAIYTKTISQLLNPSNEFSDKKYKRGIKNFFLIVSFLLCTLGICLVIVAIRNDQNAHTLFLVAFLLVFIGLFIFYRNSSIVIMKIFSYFHKWRYRSINNYFYGQIRCRSIFYEKQNALLAVLNMLALGTLALSLAMTNISYVNMETFYPYDLEVLIDADISWKEMQKIQQYVSEQTPISASRIYNLYKTSDEICVISLSDYNFLRRQIGKDSKQLGTGQFIIHCEERRYLDEILDRIREEPTFQIGDVNLTTSKSLVFTEAMEQVKTAGMNGYAVVVPDQFVDKAHICATRLVMMGDDIPVAMKERLEDYLHYEWTGKKEVDTKDHIYYDVIVKTWKLQNSIVGYGMIAFGGLYLAITILILLGAVISFQQLSLSEERRENFKILSSLGISWREWLVEIKREIVAKFFIPVIIPISITVVLLGVLQFVYGPYLLTDENVIWLSGLIALSIFLGIYCVYLFLVYWTCCYVMKK